MAASVEELGGTPRDARFFEDFQSEADTVARRYCPPDLEIGDLKLIRRLQLSVFRRCML